MDDVEVAVYASWILVEQDSTFLPGPNVDEQSEHL